MVKKVIGVDLFAGAGGMSLGAEWAGVEVEYAVESDPYAAATYSHNHPKTKIFNNDIRKLKNLKLKKQKNSSILFGGPPCQGFSTSNQRTRKVNNPNNWLFKEYIRIVKMINPDWIVFENVKGLKDTENGFFLELVMCEFEKLGYHLSLNLLDAANFGVPQKRTRLFLIGSLHGISVNIRNGKNRRPITIREAISDLPRLENGSSENWKKYRYLSQTGFAKKMRGKSKLSPNHLVTKNSTPILERYKHVPQGGNWENIPKRLMKNYQDVSRCHTGIYQRLKLDAPSTVIGNYRKNMLIHPTQNRGLSVREAARIQSFPDFFEFKGSIGYQQQQVGNAVPPLLSKAVFDAILKS